MSGSPFLFCLEQLFHMVEDNAAELHLGEQRIIPGPAITGKYLDMIRLDAKTAPSSETSLATMKSRFFFASFFLA